MQNEFSELKKDDLGDGLYIAQDEKMFRFGIDAVILADFAAERMKNNKEVFDLCCGNGIVALLLYSRNNTLKITGVEINKRSAMLAAYNVMENGLSGQIHIMNDDIRCLDSRLYSKISYITVNPPYIPVDSGLSNSDEALGSAKHELSLTLEELCVCAKRLLKDKGQIFMVHRAHRIAEIIAMFARYSLSVKTIRFVRPKPDKNANLVLIEAMKNSGDFTVVLPELIVYNENNEYTDEIYKIYRMMKKDPRNGI